MEMTPSEVSSGMDVQARMEAFLDAEERQPEEIDEEDGEVAQEQAEASEETGVSQEEAEESEEAENSEGDLETISISGEEIQLPKEIAAKVSNLKRSLEADYTRKTQEAAEIRKQALEFHEQSKQRIAFEQQNVDMLSKMQSVETQLKDYDNVDWAALAEQDIALYSKHKEIRDGLRNNYQEIQQELGKRQQFAQQLEAKVQQEQMQQTVELIKRAVPDYFEKYDDRVVSVAENLASKYGLRIDQQALRSLSRDPLIVLGLVELARYQEKDASLQAKRSEIGKKMEAVPKKMQKAAYGKQQNHKSQDLRDKLRKTGRDEYAAKLIENLL